jgi:hypothetical protein
MTPRWMLVLLVLAGIWPTPSSAQIFASYSCHDGAQFGAAFYEGSVALQLDGKALLLPRRLALPGNVRYSRSGVSISIRKQGQSLTLRRAGMRSECSSQTILPFIRPAESDDEE